MQFFYKPLQLTIEEALSRGARERKMQELQRAWPSFERKLSNYFLQLSFQDLKEFTEHWNLEDIVTLFGAVGLSKA